MAIAVPGWPEFACWTASIARVRIVLIESWSWFTLSSHQQPHLPIERLLGGDIHLVARLRRLQNRPRELGMDIAAEQAFDRRSEEHTSELQSRSDLVCRLLLA